MFANEESDSSARADSQGEATNVLARPLVLVADDDADFRATLVSALARMGMRVAEVESGNALIAALGATDKSATAPDLVITDNHMPGCSGLTALAVMQEAGLATPVIVMTAERDDATRDRAKRYGAIALLHKPFDVQELRAVIDRALR